MSELNEIDVFIEVIVVMSCVEATRWGWGLGKYRIVSLGHMQCGRACPQ